MALICPTCQIALSNVGGRLLLCMGLFSMFWERVWRSASVNVLCPVIAAISRTSTLLAASRDVAASRRPCTLQRLGQSGLGRVDRPSIANDFDRIVQNVLVHRASDTAAACCGGRAGSRAKMDGDDLPKHLPKTQIANKRRALGEGCASTAPCVVSCRSFGGGLRFRR